MAGNAKDSRILEYKDLISQLNTTIAAQTEMIKSLQQTLEADRAEKKILQEKIDYLTNKLFGTSSEKCKGIEGQINLFDEAEQEATVDLEVPVITVPEHKRKSKSTHKELFEGCHLGMRLFPYQRINVTAWNAMLLWNQLEKSLYVMSSVLRPPREKL